MLPMVHFMLQAMTPLAVILMIKDFQMTSTLLELSGTLVKLTSTLMVIPTTLLIKVSHKVDGHSMMLTSSSFSTWLLVETGQDTQTNQLSSLSSSKLTM
jgi:hypothetical protein